MNALALGLALLGLLLVVGGWTHYLTLIPQARVPKSPALHAVIMSAGLAAGLASLVFASSIVPWLLAPLTLASGGLFLWLLPQRHLPEGTLKVALGEPLPAFKAWDHTGNAFSSSSFAGKRVLLKFFRGHW